LEGKLVKYLVALTSLFLAGAPHFGFAAGRAFLNSQPQNIDRPLQQATTALGKSVLQERLHACFTLKTDKPEKRTLSSRRSTCFTVNVSPGEATQIWLDQPVDFEMTITGKTAQMHVDGFEFGVETLTIAEPGSYRVQIRKVDSAPGAVTFSLVRKKLETQKASAWEQAEIWATRSKRTKKTEDIDTSLALWEDLGDTSSIARTYLKRGSMLSKQTEPAGARVAYEKALELCEANFDPRCSAEAENNSGQMSSRLGDFNNAQQRLEEAAKDWRKLADRENEGVTLSNLGLMLWQVGDFEKAIAFLNQAGELLRSRSTKGYGKALNNLGLCYQSLAEYERAQGYFNSAARALERSKSLPELVRTRINLGRNYMLDGDLQRAQQILESAVAEADKLSNLQTRADALRNLAQNLWRMGQLEPARARLELALEADHFDGDRRGQSSALHYLGLIAQKSGDIATARSLLTEAAALRREVGLRDDATESLFELASLEYHAGHLDAARDFTEQALTLIELVRSQTPSPTLRAYYYSRKRQFFDLLVEIAMTPGNLNATADGLLAAERGRSRALMDLLASGSVLGPLPGDMAERHANNQRQLDYLSSLLSRTQPDKDIGLRFQKLLEDDEALKERIHTSLTNQKLAEPIKSVKDLQSDLVLSGCGLLEYHIGARQSYLWFVDAHQIQVFTLPSAATIESEARPVVDGFGHILERRRSPSQRAAYNRALKKLSATLLGQLSTIHLPERLILVPDGVLHRVPFAALQLPDGVERLGLAHDLVQIPSATYLVVGAQPRPIQKFLQTILAITDPVFSANDPRVTGNRSQSQAADIDLARLPFNYEIETIESRVPRSRFRILRGFAASRATLRHLRTEDYGVLHFSTHALIDDRIPERSWIALSGVDRAGHPVEDMGLLYPYQLAQFHLSSSIVVLSACDTALGRQVLGEGLMGFSSSLLYAGGSQLVLTLTEVDGEASSRFLRDVYRQYLPGNNSMEHSITIARRAMARSRRFSDPYYWASFIVIGRPANTTNTGFASMQDWK
jgi:CHAT domain-containing protein/Tfp pilus assembly protein PilF